MATKKDLIKRLKARLDYLSQEDAKIAVDSVIEGLKEALCQKNSIQIRGFGSLSVREKKFSGKDEKYNTVYFRMSKAVQDALKAVLVNRN